MTCNQFNIVVLHHTINNSFHDNKGDILIDRRNKSSLRFIYYMASIHFQGSKFKYSPFHILYGIHYRIYFQGSKFKQPLFHILHGIHYSIHFQGSKFINHQQILNFLSYIIETSRSHNMLCICLANMYTCRSLSYTCR